MTQATFLMSFDCEGKWGMADKLTPQHDDIFRHERLTWAYQQIIDLLARYNIKATFAFVGAFILSVEEYRERERDFLQHPDRASRARLRRFNADAAHNRFEGWLNPDILSIVASHPEHEIGVHGFTHISLGNSVISREGFEHEMNCLKNIPAFQQDNLTLIYPRHVVGYTELLPQYGFIGYRKSLRGDASHPLVRCLNLIDEINVFQAAQAHAEPDTLVKIPAGFMLNWRAGIRKNIPFNMTVTRWKHLLADAIASQKVVHLWTHPHNYIIGDNMFGLLEEVLKQVSSAQQAGTMANPTLREYARQIQSEYDDRRH